jgi:transposase
MIDGQRRTASRRIFAAAYKKKILAEADAAAGSGQIGELLRREGIYSSTLTRWRRERDDAVDSAFALKRGPEPKRNPLTAENEKLRRQNQRLQEELRKAEIIIDVPKKVAMLLGRPLPLVPDSENS